MAETRPSDLVILKILNGTQSGVEVSLVPGDYGLGTGADDDIQLIDVGIKPGHARLRVSTGKIELAGASGTLKTAAGVTFEANNSWQELEPLDVVTAGTTRFALGHPTSKWDTIVEDEGDTSSSHVSRPPSATWWPGAMAASGHQWRAIIVPLVALVLLLAFAGWLVLGGGLGQIANRMDRHQDDLAVTREALDQFPFGRSVKTNQEVDGVVYVNGYVESPVERRALTAAVEKTGVPARIRLSVLQNLRSEVENLIVSQKVPVTFQIAQNGELTLEGLILNEAQATRLVELIKERVLGISEVKSRIRTAATLLGDVEKLAVSTQVQPYVLFRVNNDLIEATGAVPADKVDAFVGFLQSYARRFAREIALRSFVQLQGRGEAAGDRAIVLGGTARDGDLALDADRLNRGTYKLGDIFPGAGEAARSAAAQAGPKTGLSDAPAQDPKSAASRGLGGLAQDQKGASSRVPGVLAGSSFGDGASSADAALALAGDMRSKVLTANSGPVAISQLTDRGRQLLERSKNGRLGGDATGKSLQSALDTLRYDDPQSDSQSVIPSWYLPLLSDASEGENISSCWPGTKLRARDALAALFWLDLMSTNEGATLAALSGDMQLPLLETALNPQPTAACTKRNPETARASEHSIYLREVTRNPSFVRFIVRDLPPFPLDIAGASLLQPRYVLTRTGRRMFEGSAPDVSSRVALIGDLGIAVQLKSGLAAVVFDPDMSWKITQ